MYCKHCGKQIADDSRFCNLCGGQQSQIPITQPIDSAKQIPKLSLEPIINLIRSKDKKLQICIVASVFIIVFVIMFISLASWMNNKAWFNSDGFVFTEHNNGYMVVAYWGKNDDNLVFPSEHNGKPVVGIAEGLWGHCANWRKIHSIYIPETITYEDSLASVTPNHFPSLSEIEIASENPSFRSYDNQVYKIKNGELRLYYEID